MKKIILSILFLGIVQAFCLGKNNPDSTKIFSLLQRGYKIIYTTPDISIQKIDSAINISTEAKYDFGLMKSLNLKGIAYDIKGKNDSALHCYRSSIVIAQQIKDSLSEARAQNNIGLIHWNQQALDSALWYYKAATQTFKALKAAKPEANGLNNIGLIYEDLNQPEVAEGYFKKAIEKYAQLNDTFGLGASYLNIGLVQTNPDSSLKYLNISVPFLTKTNNTYGLSRCFNNLALAFKKKGMNKLGIKYYKESIRLKNTNKDLYGVASTFNNIAYLFLSDSSDVYNLDSSIYYLQKAKKKSEKNNYERLNYKLYNNFAIYYDKRQQLDSALKYQKKKHSAYLEVLNLQKEEKIQELEIQFNIERKQNQIEALEKEKEIQKLVAQKRKSTIIGLLALVILLIILGTLVFYFFRNKQQLKYQRELTKQRELGLSATIQAAENERARIAKDLHDGIGQQLAAIKLQYTSFEHRFNHNLPINYTEAKNFENLIDQVAKEVRDISHQMMPKSLQQNGLILATEQLLHNTFNDSGINYQFEHFGFSARLSKKIELALYRVIQELIKNIIVHAQAKNVAVQLLKTKAQVVLIIEDDGVGFSSTKKKKSDGIGLLSLQSRVSDVNGKINFEPSPKSGTLVTARIPFK